MSGAIPPSERILGLLFEKLCPGTNGGYDLVFAHMRDELVSAGIPIDDIIIRRREGDEQLTDWWGSLSNARRERLRLLEEGARADDTFDQLLSDLETLGVKLQGGKADSEKLARLVRGEVYPFPDSNAVPAVAEDPPAGSPVDATVSSESARRNQAKRAKKSS